jgi:pentatricopeptide repeat protein
MWRDQVTYYSFSFLETEDGYVEVSGFTENAPTLVRYAVKVGDRVLAVDSSLGDKMWPVSTVDGVISSVTSRLPGQQITLRFERSLENIEKSASTELPGASVAVEEPAVEAQAISTIAIEDKVLLKRCREIIRRYTTDDQEKGNFVNKYAVQGLVADKVVDALASAGAKVDTVTLSMIMSAYLSCRQSQKAIDTFEAMVGLRADGSMNEATAKIQGTNGNKIGANLSALDVYTVSALLKAHAIAGDLFSVKRVLAAVEGQAGSEVGGMEVASWPGTGSEGLLKPDTRCYNIVISAAANSRSQDGLDLAMNIFNSMSEPNQADCEKQKNIVSYNIVMNALTNRSRYQEAIDLFYKMIGFGVKPDKLSYTSLVKAITSEGDVEVNLEELFYDMREQGVVPDVITFNTAIKSLCDQRKIAAAKKIVDLMQGTAVSPNSMTYGLLMTGLIESNNPGAALLLFETACSDRRTVAFTENTYIYTTAVSAAASIGDHNRALELLSRMKSIGVKPNLKTMTAVMGACIAGGKPALAVDIYRRLPNPDGYAMAQGLQALSESGNIEEALSLLSQQRGRTLTGKQEMRSYNIMIQNALKDGEYDTARKVMATLFREGKIPSKVTYQGVFDAMGLFPKGRNRLSSPVEYADEEDSLEKFKFLLFVLDSVSSRNLPCEGPLYSAILTYGFRIGGLPRKMASLLATAKIDISVGTKLIDDENCDDSGCLFMFWEDLFSSYDEMKERIATDGLPKLVVRTGARDLANILRAENNLSYRRSKLV